MTGPYRLNDIYGMTSQPKHAASSETPMIVLTPNDISTEKVENATSVVVSADQMEDVSFYANGQNAQNFQNN